MSSRLTQLLAGAAATALVGGLGAAQLPASASALSTPRCTNADLTLSYRHTDSGAGHSYGRMVIVNTSGHACHTGGYGGVSYVGNGDGTQIGAAAVRTNPGQVRTYVLDPGQRLRSPIDEVSAFNFPQRRCGRAHVDGFRVYVPNAVKSQYVVHPTTGCRNDAIKLIYQKPYRRS